MSRADSIIEALKSLHVMRGIKNVKVMQSMDRLGNDTSISKVEFVVGDKVILGKKEGSNQWVQIAVGAKGQFLLASSDIAKLELE